MKTSNMIKSAAVLLFVLGGVQVVCAYTNPTSITHAGLDANATDGSKVGVLGNDAAALRLNDTTHATPR